MTGLKLNISEHLPAAVGNLVPEEHVVINVAPFIILQSVLLIILLVRGLM